MEIPKNSNNYNNDDHFERIVLLSEVTFSNFDYLKDTLYIFARRYSEQAYQVPYISINVKEPDPIYIKNTKGQYQLMKTSLDCFSFIWLVLRDLNRYGHITLPKGYLKDMVQVVQKAIDAGSLKEFKSEEQLFDKECGILFYLKSAEGFTKVGERHMGFWFRFEGDIYFIHNSYLKGGVVEQRFTISEFTTTTLLSKYKTFL
jgi:hypothetical protein